MTSCIFFYSVTFPLRRIESASFSCKHEGKSNPRILRLWVKLPLSSLPAASWHDIGPLSWDANISAEQDAPLQYINNLWTWSSCFALWWCGWTGKPYFYHYFEFFVNLLIFVWFYFSWLWALMFFSRITLWVDAEWINCLSLKIVSD